MARLSSVDRLEAEIREEIARLRTECGRTLDEILTHLRQLGVGVSRSALGRHIQKLDVVAERIRRSRGIAEGLASRGLAEGDTRTARVNIELLHGMLLDLLAGEDGDEVRLDPKDAMFLADALAKLGRASAASLAQELAIRRELAKEAAAKVEEVAKAQGLSAETVSSFRAAILGIAERREGA